MCMSGATLKRKIRTAPCLIVLDTYPLMGDDEHGSFSSTFDLRKKKQK